MVTFILILAGLITFNFILLKFSMQSIDADKKKSKRGKVRINSISNSKSKAEEIPNAA
ncbi:hypothetical protein [Aquimarina sp. 2304DJ70-9]|uniref:hypothetical protein n=1 Tax=Aquimarina penaris TaxID=3231044 RepID=UPI003461E87C